MPDEANQAASNEEEDVKKLKKKSFQKKKDDEDEGGVDPNAWMVTFSDLITLMMTFFVLLFSFNDPNPQPQEAVTTNQPGIFSLLPSKTFQPVNVLQANSLYQQNLEIFLSENTVNQIKVSENEEGTLITLPADLLFEPGDATLSASSVSTLGTIAHYLNKTTHRIRVEGHTDDQFQGNDLYEDEWDLSLSRAQAVLEVLLKQEIQPKRLSLVGKGSQYPKISNETSEGRQVNRRVELVILNKPNLGGVYGR